MLRRPCPAHSGYIQREALNRQERPYHNDSTASRLLSEVKHCRAWLVLRWGTTLESQVLFFCHFLFPCTHNPMPYTFFYIPKSMLLLLQISLTFWSLLNPIYLPTLSTCSYPSYCPPTTSYFPFPSLCFTFISFGFVDEFLG